MQLLPLQLHRTTLTGPLAALWREYALADTRWGTSDPTVVSIELVTVFGAGPLAAYCADGMRKPQNEAWRLWMCVRTDLFTDSMQPVLTFLTAQHHLVVRCNPIRKLHPIC